MPLVAALRQEFSGPFPEVGISTDLTFSILDRNKELEPFCSQNLLSFGQESHAHSFPHCFSYELSGRQSQ